MLECSYNGQSMRTVVAPLHASVSSYKILSKDLGTLGHKYKMRVQEFF